MGFGHKSVRILVTEEKLQVRNFVPPYGERERKREREIPQIFRYDDIVRQNPASIQIVYMWKYWVKFNYFQCSWRWFSMISIKLMLENLNKMGLWNHIYVAYETVGSSSYRTIDIGLNDRVPYRMWWIPKKQWGCNLFTLYVKLSTRILSLKVLKKDIFV